MLYGICENNPGLFTLCSCGMVVSMTQPSPSDEIDETIAFALAQFPYQPPRTRDTDQRRSYFLAVAQAVRKQLQFSWTFRKNPPQRLAVSEWKPDGNDTTNPHRGTPGPG